MRIPLVDLHAQYLAYRSEIDAAINRVIQESAFIGGEVVREFEAAFTREYGIKHCISVANGTDAIFVALKMLGMGPGDEVITTAHSWISTSEAISQTGAQPVFVDVDGFYSIDANKIESMITPKTRMIMPVHLYGQPTDMGKIMALARKHHLLVLEDCAQAHFAAWNGQLVGTFGDVATFSFYPGKNLGAYGDAGGIVTNSDELATRMRMYANHGALKKHIHLMEGVNSRLDGLQAAILSAKLPHIHEWTKRRQDVAALYDGCLSEILPEESLPKVRKGATHVYHLYVIQVDHRDEMAAYLSAQGVQTAVHYPVALPLMPAYSYLGHSPVDFPNAARNQARVLSLPIYPEMTSDMVRYVADVIAKFHRGSQD